MYTAFYGLREKPFMLSPNPRYLYLSESHREALAHLLYGIEQGEGFIAITGEVGTGKTTLCRTLLERMGPATDVAFLFNPSRSGMELLQTIAQEFDLPVDDLTRRELHDQLNRFLLARKGEGRRVLLIVDEAQNLSHGTLEQIRLLSNLETSSEKLIQILLLGQPELDTKLDSHRLRQLRQRISVRWMLKPLSPKDTRRYVLHRLQVAAGMSRDERKFLYMPLQHSEDAADQARSVELFRALEDDDTFKYTLCHQEIIARFGRFPHRNADLGRESTAEEIAFLQEPDSSF